MRMSTTLFLISGDSKSIIAAHKLPHDTLVIPFSEKQLLSLRSTVKFIRSTPTHTVVFGMKKLSLQRYHQILKGVLLLAGKTSGYLADETGERSVYSPLHTIFVESFILATEIVASCGIVAQAWIRLRLRARTEKRGGLS